MLGVFVLLDARFCTQFYHIARKYSPRSVACSALPETVERCSDSRHVGTLFLQPPWQFDLNIFAGVSDNNQSWRGRFKKNQRPSYTLKSWSESPTLKSASSYKSIYLFAWDTRGEFRVCKSARAEISACSDKTLNMQIGADKPICISYESPAFIRLVMVWHFKSSKYERREVGCSKATCETWSSVVLISQCWMARKRRRTAMRT